LKKVAYTLKDNEKISKLEIRSGDWIDNIAFTTNTGGYFKVGGNGGSLKVFNITELVKEGELIGFYT
jgi:hypothetical protein